jgi:hypothetical protein
MVCSKLAFAVEICVVCSDSVFATKIMLFIANRHSLQNCVVYSELVFIAKIVLSIANQRSVSKLCCLY